MTKINIGQDFNDNPIGRFYSDGPGSGEEFREEKLLPALKKLKTNEKLEVIIDDGVDGYGSSFLVEGFAGCVKYGHFKSGELLKKLKIKYDDEEFKFFADKIGQYINEAEKNEGSD